ncbi:uncharacterized protein LOC115324540 [Ixodes scapularis]|uniref:uncharacterized protein LOC115324540 n=1 Tax=Ixodes scapularis TaxID=6945 RepID=UPI001C393E61|nr:uncharacterized protein LOC115324540 [Ixodes scapularis]
MRHDGETAADFFACLNKLADDCGFGAFRNRMLRDRIVGGINDEMIQRRLLEIPDLTLDLAKKTVVAMEAAKKDSQMLSTSIQPNLASANTLSRDAAVNPKWKTGTISCFRCGGEHYATQCRHASTTCHKCRGKGHLARVCKGKTADATAGGPTTSTRIPRSVHTLDGAGQSQDVSLPEVYEMWEMTSSAVDGQPFRVEVTVNGTPLLMELDTGASVSVVSEETFRREFPSRQLDPSRLMLKNYSGELSPVQGSLSATVRLGNRECQDILYVVPGTCPSLLGRGWMKGLGIKLSNAKDVNFVTSVANLVAEYSSIFDEGLGTFKGVAAKINLQDNAKPRCVYDQIANDCGALSPKVFRTNKHMGVVAAVMANGSCQNDMFGY